MLKPSRLACSNAQIGAFSLPSFPCLLEGKEPCSPMVAEGKYREKREEHRKERARTQEDTERRRRRRRMKMG